MSGAREYLAKLGSALSEHGLTVRMIAGDPPLLHVENPIPPTLNELIGCRPGAGTALWFHWAALDVLLAPVADIPSAVERVAFVLNVPVGGADE